MIINILKAGTLFMLKSLASAAIFFVMILTSTSGFTQSEEIAPPTEEFKERDTRNEGYAYVDRYARWNLPDNAIPVCIEVDSFGFQSELNWVKDSISKTWEHYSSITFTGWQPCPDSFNGIRIGVGDVGPHVKYLGRKLAGVRKGMMLNFKFAKWGPACQEKREACIRSIAVHEFGHALGFAHEQNSPDAPGECAIQAQGPNGDEMLTPYDPESVMNYCNPLYNNGGKLSKKDIIGLQKFYSIPSRVKD